MIVKNGEIIAINSVKTDNTLSGNGVTAPLGVNTPVVIDPLVSAINRNKQNISAVSAEVNRVSDQVDLVSNALLEEQETREEADERLNTEINKNKQNISVVSAKVDNVAEQVNEVSGKLDDVSARVDEVSGKLDDEISARISADEVLSASINDVSGKLDEVSGKLDGEISDRISADEALSASISDVSAYIDEVSSKLDTVSAYVDEVSGKLDDEILDRISVDEALSAVIDHLSGDIAVVASALLEEAEAREEADNVLSALIDDVSAYVDEVSGKLDDEISDRISADDALSASIDQLSGDIALVASALLEEAEIRKEADKALSASINDVSAYVDEVSGKLDEVSGKLDDEILNRINADEALSASIDQLSGDIALVASALLEEAEIREEVDDLLSAAIDTKQNILSAGDNIAIENDVISVSGTESVRLHYPLFGRETTDGLVIGIKDHTHHLYNSYSSRNIANPIAGRHIYEDWFKIDNNQLNVDEHIKNFTLNFAYTVDGNFHPDFIYETQMNVIDASGNIVFNDTQAISNRSTHAFSVELKNNSPYSITYAGDTAAFTGLSATISCHGTYWPDYSYLDDADIGDGNVKRILVWDPDVLGVETGTEDIVGADDDTAIGV